MAFCPNEMDEIDGSLNETRWFYAPTGRKVIAQGKAKRRPGIRVPETTQALKGRNDPTEKPMRDVHTMAAHRRRHHIQRTQGGASLYPGLSH